MIEQGSGRVIEGGGGSGGGSDGETIGAYDIAAALCKVFRVIVGDLSWRKWLM